MRPKTSWTNRRKTRKRPRRKTTIESSRLGLAGLHPPEQDSVMVIADAVDLVGH